MEYALAVMPDVPNASPQLALPKSGSEFGDDDEPEIDEIMKELEQSAKDVPRVALGCVMFS